MTGHIVPHSGGDLSYDSLDYDSLFAIGLMLFVDYSAAEPCQPAGRAAFPRGV